jgi:hypothetical protein
MIEALRMAECPMLKSSKDRYLIEVIRSCMIKLSDDERNNFLAGIRKEKWNVVL